MKIILIDNFDSFTYNLVHYLEGFDCEVSVYQNNQIPFDEISNFDKAVLSPGPGLPETSGDLMKFISKFYNQLPIMGVCLGFQALVEHFGGELYNQENVKHGVAEKATFDTSSRLFKNLPSAFNVGLYHSWAAKENLPEVLRETSRSESNVIMAFEHDTLPICGVQFHPESILTEHGKQIVENFLFNFN